MGHHNDALLRVCLIGVLALAPFAAPAAFAAQGASPVEEVVVVGSRRPGRSATDSPVPVDVVNGDDFQAQGTSDMDDLLRNLLPSYNVQRLSISDAATITRPATLRGLPPDDTLVLINGKRMHRASVIAELGGSLAAGSQGPDISVIPPLAIDRVEVLRDGASAQYGSDAIAGVINFVLKQDREGINAEAKYGEFYEGNSSLWQGAVNIGMPLGDDGFANATLQVKSADATSRSLQRTDAAALIATGNTDVPVPAQIWGDPKVDDDIAFFLNSGIQLTDSQELYGFGNYAERKVTGGFFYRNPNARPGVFTDSFSGGQRAIVDTSLAGQSGQVSNCPLLQSPGSTPTDQAVVDADNAALAALPPNCWVVNDLYPGGYTPAFGGDVEDISALLGLRGSVDSGLTYDFSVGMGRNETAFRIDNTLNPSLGPGTPTSFHLGKYIQVEQNYNADFTYPLHVEAFASDVNVAFGAEYRVETFKILIGDEASWNAGPYAFQNDNFQSDGVTPLLSMSIGAHGFAGFSPRQAGEFDRANYALYTDWEADVTDRWLVDIALRYEDFEDFGSTTNGKLATRFDLTPTLSLRGSVSTGFRAPTPGQSNVTKVSTVTVDGELQQRGQIPPTNPIAKFLGGKALDAEDATNLTLGFAWDPINDLTLTVDYFRIEVTDRISQTGTIDITTQPVDPNLNCPGAANLAQCLEALGVPGASDLTSISFFTNDFDTTTTGVDAVATYTQDWGDLGLTSFTAAWNYTETTVDKAGRAVSRNRVVDLENFNPENRGVFTINHTLADWRFLVRASFYDDWVSGDFSGDPNAVNNATQYKIDCTQDSCYDGAWIFDAEVGYSLAERYHFIVGAQNLFDNNGPRDANNTAGPRFSNNSGEAYATSTPWGFDGGFYYFRFTANLDY